jgi:predicted ribosome quality control (RQC) complex YloA/Tae2 family protein
VIRHHLTLEHIAQRLDDHLCGAEVLEIFTQEKHVVTLCFLKDREEIVITASVDPSTGCIVERHHLHRARRNTIDLFPMLIGRRCLRVRKHPTDRIVTFDFDGMQLHVLLYGGASGNILVTDAEAVIDALRGARSLVGAAMPTPSADTPPLGKWYQPLRDAGIDVVTAARSTTTYYVLEQGGEVLFSLLPLEGWTILEATDDLFAALRRTMGLRRTRRRTDDLRRRLLQDLQRRLERTERSLDAMRREVATADRASIYRRHADLLMAMPDPRRNGIDHIDTVDWDGTPIVIALEPTRSLIENAADYYARAKRSEQAAAMRSRRIPQFESRRDATQDLLSQVRTATTIDDLTTIQEVVMRASSDVPREESKYRTFVLDDTYTLYVGRNAANNDELTMRFAKQNDWWFHARGVSGSHAVLRGGGNERPPKHILEQAAALAAWYSQSRNASYTPVVYTQRKYVRKPKGANVGAVTLEREQVIMVRPAGPESE